MFSNSKLILALRILRSLPYSIFFNFTYLPLKQAIRIPILLYKPNLLKLKGSVVIESEKVKFGMIMLGFFTVSLYRNDGIVWENHGGQCVFHGKCKIGNSSAISIGKKGFVEFGKNFISTAMLKIATYHKIKFGDEVLVGWENTFFDTDFHKMTNITNGDDFKKAYAPIIIGNNNWFGCKNVILKGSSTPDFCTVGSYSLLNKKYLHPSYSVIAGNPIKLVAEGLYRNPDNDIIKY